MQSREICLPEPEHLTDVREVPKVKGMCATPECEYLADEGCEHCPIHELEAAIEAGDLELVNYWQAIVQGESIQFSKTTYLAMCLCWAAK